MGQINEHSDSDSEWRERKCPIFETVAKGDSNPGSVDCESGILPLSAAHEDKKRQRRRKSTCNNFRRVVSRIDNRQGEVEKLNLFP